MKCSVKWILTILPIFMVYLAQGVQFTIILPTLYDYIIVHFKGQEWMYSLAVSATSLSNVVVGPVLGILYDRTHASKLLVVITLASAAIGAFLYFAAVSPYMVIGGRMLQGFALSSGTVISGELSRITTKKERTAVFSSLTAVTQIGYVLGPGLNLLLKYCDFQVGPFVVDKDRSPALFITLYWIITAVLFSVFYFHMPTVEEEDGSKVTTINDSVSSSYHEEMDDKSLASNYSDKYRTAHQRGYEILEVTGLNGIATRVSYSRRNSLSSVHTANSGVGDHHGSIANGDSLSKDLSYSLEDSEKSDSRSEKFHQPTCCSRVFGKIRYLCSRVLAAASMLLWEDIVILYFIILIMMFSQISVEVAFTPISQKYFNWGEDGISIFFSATGVLMIIVSVVLSVLSKRVEDKWMIMTGLFAQFIACSWLLGWFYFIKTVNATVVVSQFIIGTTISLLTEPITLGSAVSLFSKKVAPEIQGIGHGLRRSMVSLGSVLGSLWAAAALQLESNTILYGGPIGLVALATLLSILSFKKMNG